MLKEQYPYYLANKPQQPNADLEVIDKFRGTVATRVALANAKARGGRLGGAQAGRHVEIVGARAFFSDNSGRMSDLF